MSTYFTSRIKHAFSYYSFEQTITWETLSTGDNDHMLKLCFKKTIYSSLLYIIICYLDYDIYAKDIDYALLYDLTWTHLHYICNEMILEIHPSKDDHDNTWQSRIALSDDKFDAYDVLDRSLV